MQLRRQLAAEEARGQSLAHELASCRASLENVEASRESFRHREAELRASLRSAEQRVADVTRSQAANSNYSLSLEEQNRIMSESLRSMETAKQLSDYRNKELLGELALCQQRLDESAETLQQRKKLEHTAEQTLEEAKIREGLLRRALRAPSERASFPFNRTDASDGGVDRLSLPRW
jgi:hypothetical protein